MGVIKDGSISGRIPSSEAFVIHYPAYPSSISRAVDTLGGADAVTKARNSKSNELELRFRPEDPYSHPTFGRLYNCNNLLLRICRKPSGNNPKEDRHTAKPNHYEDSSSKSGEPSSIQEFTTSNDDMQICLTADVIARVKESYEFKGMADYQHILPSQGDVIHRKKKRHPIAEGPKEKEDLAPVSNEEIMALLPLLFSPKDLPQTVALRPSPMLSSMKKQEAVVTHRWEGDSLVLLLQNFNAKLRYYPNLLAFCLLPRITGMEIESSIAIGFGIKDVPKKVNWEQYVPENSEQWKWQMEVSKLFEERPIWPRASIHERFSDMGRKFSVIGLKRLLFRSAYYFGSGPFQRFWIRKGYDPRKDPESRIYQRIEFRVPKPVVDGQATKGVKHRWDDICAFRVLPTKRQLHLQLFEVSDDFIQQEIRKPPTETVCSPLTGWFSSYFLDCMRSCIAVRFLSIYTGTEAGSLLKSANVKFKRSIRTRFQPNNFRDVEEIPSRVNQEPVTGVDKGGVSDDLDEEEEEEYKDEEEEDKEEEGEEDEKEGEEEEDEDVEDENEDNEDGDEDDEDEDDNEEEGGDEEEEELEENEDNIEEDAYEEINEHHSSHLAVEKDNPLLKGSTAGNFSQSYLEDLLGSFPSTESGGVQDEDAVGEYEIYERDSGSSDSDDDYSFL